MFHNFRTRILKNDEKVPICKCFVWNRFDGSKEGGASEVQIAAVSDSKRRLEAAVDG